MTPWETNDQYSSEIGNHHRRFLSMNHHKFAGTIETESQRSHQSLFKKYPTFKTLSQSNQQIENSRYGTLTQHRKSKASHSLIRSGMMLKQQLKIKNFMLMGKENKSGVSLRERFGIKKESNYILRQKYANLRGNSRLTSSRNELTLTISKMGR